MDIARVSRSHNDTNVLCLGARFLSEEQARAIADAWLETPFEGGRHAGRLAKIAALEAEQRTFAAVERELELLARQRAVERIWGRDPAVFTPEAETQEPIRKSILNRLGWLRAPEEMAARVEEVETFRGRRAGARVSPGGPAGHGGQLALPGGLEPHVRRRPGPGAVGAGQHRPGGGGRDRAVDRLRPDPVRRGFQVGRHHRGGGLREHLLGEGAGPAGLRTGAPAVLRHHRSGDRACTIGPGTATTRCSSTPATSGAATRPCLCSGWCRRRCWAWTCAARWRAGDRRRRPAAGRAPARIPGAVLGAFMGGLNKQGRDKLTLVLAPEIASLGAWIEQLVAESTGKLGRGRRADRSRAAGPPLGVRRRPGLRVRRPGGRPAGRRAGRDRGAAVGGPSRPAGHPAGPLRPGGRVLSLGVRHRCGRRQPGGQSLRRAQRHPGQGGHRPRPQGVLGTRAPCPTRAPTLRPADRDALLDHLGSARPGDYLALCAFFQRTDRPGPAADRAAPAVPGPLAGGDDRWATGPASCTRPVSCTRAGRQQRRVPAAHRRRGHRHRGARSGASASGSCGTRRRSATSRLCASTTAGWRGSTWAATYRVASSELDRSRFEAARA